MNRRIPAPLTKTSRRGPRFWIPLGCAVLSFAGLAPWVVRAAAAQDAQLKPEAPKRMAAGADPSYEVATIKPSNPEGGSAGFHMRGRRLFIENKTLRQIFIFAYGVHPKQLAGEPAWFASDRYDIDGVLDTDGEPSLKQLQHIVQKLLAERFALKFHRETRELLVYALTVAQSGSKITKSKDDPNALGDEEDDTRAGQATMTVTNMSMTDFTLIMQFWVDRPVVDQTGLAGKWDFKWTWTVDESRVPADATNPPPGIFTAIQEQLGLKLDAVKAPAEVLVVDRVERPSPN
jgi:uncharacterized protein (TIGR03435 family)